LEEPGPWLAPPSWKGWKTGLEPVAGGAPWFSITLLGIYMINNTKLTTFPANRPANGDTCAIVVGFIGLAWLNGLFDSSIIFFILSL